MFTEAEIEQLANEARKIWHGGKDRPAVLEPFESYLKRSWVNATRHIIAATMKRAIDRVDGDDEQPRV